MFDPRINAAYGCGRRGSRFFSLGGLGSGSGRLGGCGGHGDSDFLNSGSGGSLGLGHYRSEKR
jgi:hypothetical protein